MNNFRAYISTGVKYIIFLNNLVWVISKKRGTFRNHVKNRIDGVFKKKTYVYAALELMNKYIKKRNWIYDAWAKLYVSQIWLELLKTTYRSHVLYWYLTLQVRNPPLSVFGQNNSLGFKPFDLIILRRISVG